MKFLVLSFQCSVFSSELHPINAAGLVLNGSMMLCLVLVIVFGRRRLAKRRKARPVMTLLTDPRQCYEFFRHISRPCQGMTLPAPEDWQAAPVTPRVFGGFITLIIGVIILVHLVLFIIAPFVNP